MISQNKRNVMGSYGSIRKKIEEIQKLLIEAPKKQAATKTQPDTDNPKAAESEASDLESDAKLFGKIVDRLGLPNISKSKLGAAIKAGDARSSEQNKLVADFFSAMMKQDAKEFVNIIPILKKAVSKASNPKKSEEQAATDAEETPSAKSKLTDDHKKTIKDITSSLKMTPKDLGKLLRDSGIVEESMIRNRVRQKLLAAREKNTRGF